MNGQRVYGNVLRDRIADVYNGPMYRDLREWQLRSKPDSWCPAINHHCPLRTVEAAWRETTGCRVKILKIEPTTHCNLRCPACPVVTNFANDADLEEHRAHKFLPLETMVDVIDQLPDLEQILYFNFGEPFLHKQTIPFLREVRRRRPGIYIATNTNGLSLTFGQIEALANEALMDHVVFSIDGADPDSYRKYRVGGNLSKALAKMEALAHACEAAGTSGRVRITWQYILFEWNDSDEELTRAKVLAEDIGVVMDWVITHSPEPSKRFTQGSAALARLKSGTAFSISPSAPAQLASRLEGRGFRDFGAYTKLGISCELLAFGPVGTSARRWRPWRRRPNSDAARYLAHINADRTAITAPAGVPVLCEFNVQNNSANISMAEAPGELRLGIRLATSHGEVIRELPGTSIPKGAARSGGYDTVSLPIFLPELPGMYRLFIDVVQEGGCWFSDCGSRPLIISVDVR